MKSRPAHKKMTDLPPSLDFLPSRLVVRVGRLEGGSRSSIYEFGAGSLGITIPVEGFWSGKLVPLVLLFGEGLEFRSLQKIFH